MGPSASPAPSNGSGGSVWCRGFGMARETLPQLGRPCRLGTYPSCVERVVLQGLAAFRWAAWAWMVVILVVARDDVHRPAVAIAGAAAALVVSAWATAALQTNPWLLLDPRAVVAELAVGAALLVLDGLVARPDSLFTTRQSLGSAWPMAGILAAGVALGPIGGAASGVALGLARVIGVLVNDTAIGEAGRALSLLSNMFFYVLAGAAAGYLARLVVRAEKDISAARARDEVARTLHDGVLQTLALVERRADDPALARMAREQERELRAFLAGSVDAPPDGDLAAGLQRLAARFEDRYDARATVIVAPDRPRLGPAATAAVLGATGEALTNAGKHGRATAVTIYVEPQDGGTFCSIRDDGAGFDPAATVERLGTQQSIRGRIAEVGGRVTVQSRPGEGAEVCLWVP
jgi:signal transduction histidine kinase